MQCDICKKNEAVVHYAEVINGEIRKLNICEVCAKEKGFGMEVSFSMGDMLSGIIKDVKEIDKPVVSEEACGQCGMTYEEFKKTGRLGCDGCYVSFEKKLIPVLDTIHKNTRHKGKAPLAYKEKFVKIDKIRELNKQLKEAVEEEEFEKAAVIRDRIKELGEKD
jgi:protein arginine kinase activator